MYLCVGGTFWPLHRGHRHLLGTALENADRLVVGLTDDGFAAARKERELAPYPEREEALVALLRTLVKELGRQVPFEVRPLSSRLDTSSPMDEVEGIVVSADMEPSIPELQKMRREAGQPPFEVVVAEELLAQDGLPLRSSRVAAGEVDAGGRIAGKVVVAVGTANETKARAVESVFGRYFGGQQVAVERRDVASGVPDQPSGLQVPEGARRRAREAMDECPEAHFGVGIEAGLFWGEADGEPTYDVQYCAIVDRGGRVSMGHGPGYVYPDDILEAVKAGREVREVMVERYWDPADPDARGRGAVHFFSAGLMDRRTLTESAVIMALVPRVSGHHGI